MLLNSTGLEAPNFCNKKHCIDWLRWDGETDTMQKVGLFDFPFWRAFYRADEKYYKYPLI